MVPLSDLAIRTAACLAVGCYILRVECDLLSCHSRFPWRKVARALWTCGLLFHVLHVLLGFHFVHGWDHDHAVATTAARTAAVVGWRWGGGVYVNHLFALLWLADTIAWWRFGVDFPYRNRTYYYLIQGWFAFIVANATIVFGPWHWRVVAPCVVVWWFRTWWVGRYRREANAR